MSVKPKRLRALGQFASPCFVASGPASPQRTPTYASGCRPARASPDSQLAPVPRLTHHSVACLAAIGPERLGSVAGEEQAGAGEEHRGRGQSQVGAREIGGEAERE